MKTISIKEINPNQLNPRDRLKIYRHRFKAKTEIKPQAEPNPVHGQPQSQYRSISIEQFRAAVDQIGKQLIGIAEKNNNNTLIMSKASVMIAKLISDYLAQIKKIADSSANQPKRPLNLEVKFKRNTENFIQTAIIREIK